MDLGESGRGVSKGVGDAMWLTELLIAGVLFLGFELTLKALGRIAEALEQRK